MIVILFGGAFVDFQIGKSLLMSLGYVAISFVWGFYFLNSVQYENDKHNVAQFGSNIITGRNKSFLGATRFKLNHFLMTSYTLTITINMGSHLLLPFSEQFGTI